MLTDYKFWYIRRDDAGFITEAAIRFFEGEVTTASEIDEKGVSRPITRYRRIKRLQKIDQPHFAGAKTKTEFSGKEAILYNQEDFGMIQTDEELRLFTNNELAKDAVRTPIAEQKSN